MHRDGLRAALALLDESVDLPPHGSAALRVRALEHARGVVAHDHAVFMSYTDEFFAAPPAYVARYLAHAGYRLELARAFQAARHSHGAYVDTQVFARGERERMPFFRDVLRPWHIGAQIVAVVHFGGRVSGVIHLSRESGSFSDGDMARLRPLLRVIGAAHAALEPACPDLDPAASARLPGLTPREREVAELISRGHANAGIAGRLGTSIFTVRRQVESILGKCGVATRAAVASLVARGLLLERTRPRLPPAVDHALVARCWGDMQRSISPRA